MKSIFKNRSFTVLIALILLGATATMVAFKPAKHFSKVKGRATVTWFYNSNSSASSSITNGSLWTMTDPNHTGCSSQNLELPCSIEVDEAVTNTSELDQYFTDVYSDNSATIKAEANSRREAP